MRDVIKVVLLFCGVCVGQDSWLCTENSSQIRNGSLAACGVGEGSSEGIARKRAFDSAKIEFNDICGSATECSEHKYSVEPKRTSCGQANGYWKCYRLIVFTIKEAPRRNIASGIIASQSPVRMNLDDQLDGIFYRMLGGR